MEVLVALGDDAEFWERHHVRAYRLAVLLTGDPSQAEDVVAEAFTRSLPAHADGRVLDEWSYLRAAVVNAVRGAGRRRSVADRFVLRRRGDGRGDRPFDDVVADRAALLAALRSLPAAQRAAIVLRYFEDLSEAQTAAALGVAAGTVKSSVSRGIARLRAELREDG